MKFKNNTVKLSVGFFCLQFLLFTYASYSQESSERAKRFLIYGSSTRTIYNDDNTGGRVGYGAGFEYISFVGKVDLITGIGFSKNSVFKDRFFARYVGEFDMTYDLLSLSLPLVVRSKIYKKFGWGAGLFVNQAISYKYSGTKFVSCPIGACEVRYSKIEGSDGLNTTDLLLHGGITYDFKLSSINAVLLLDYNHGIISVNGVDDFPDDDLKEEAHNRFIRLSLGLRF